jgi:hypothetical protein
MYDFHFAPRWSDFVKQTSRSESFDITFDFYRNKKKGQHTNYSMHYGDSNNVAGMENIESQKLTFAFMKGMNAHNDAELPDLG